MKNFKKFTLAFALIFSLACGAEDLGSLLPGLSNGDSNGVISTPNSAGTSNGTSDGDFITDWSQLDNRISGFLDNIDLDLPVAPILGNANVSVDVSSTQIEVVYPQGTFDLMNTYFDILYEDFGYVYSYSATDAVFVADLTAVDDFFTVADILIAYYAGDGFVLMITVKNFGIKTAQLAWSDAAADIVDRAIDISIPAPAGDSLYNLYDRGYDQFAHKSDVESLDHGTEVDLYARWLVVNGFYAVSMFSDTFSYVNPEFIDSETAETGYVVHILFEANAADPLEVYIASVGLEIDISTGEVYLVETMAPKTFVTATEWSPFAQSLIEDFGYDIPVMPFSTAYNFDLTDGAIEILDYYGATESGIIESKFTAIVNTLKADEDFAFDTDAGYDLVLTGTSTVVGRREFFVNQVTDTISVVIEISYGFIAADSYGMVWASIYVIDPDVEFNNFLATLNSAVGIEEETFDALFADFYEDAYSDLYNDGCIDIYFYLGKIGTDLVDQAAATSAQMGALEDFKTLFATFGFKEVDIANSDIATDTLTEFLLDNEMSAFYTLLGFSSVVDFWAVEQADGSFFCVVFATYESSSNQIFVDLFIWVDFTSDLTFVTAVGD